MAYRAPFVLFDDRRAEGAGPVRLYSDPARIVVARRPEEVEPALAALRAGIAEGRHAAGFVAYEAGLALEPRLAPLAGPAAQEPLLWFGLFDGWETPSDQALDELLGDPAGVATGPLSPLLDRCGHAARVADVQALIAAGDLYQANLTFPAEIGVQGRPLALYARLRAARAGWGGVVFTGEHWLLSASPELFFTLEGDRLTARPMKGTAPRRDMPAEDRASADALHGDAKQRAENLMIVDLIRNDLARVAVPGSVAVPTLFEVETYPTVHHMTSTVTARLGPGEDALTTLRALFPCGSITGAPKIRAMEVIGVTESQPRGAYTGAMGWIAPWRKDDRPEGLGDAAFNVAIRTLVMEEGSDTARLGLGSAILADSDADAEYDECLLKGRFASEGAGEFDLIETMRFDADEGFVDLERHLARLKASAAALGFAFDRHDIRNELQAATFRRKTSSRVRLRFSRNGRSAIELSPLPPLPTEPVPVALRPQRHASFDFRLRHKTSDRAGRDAERRASGAWEVVYVDGDGFVTEGSFTSVFVEQDGRLVTPPLARCLMPGTFRERMIEEGRAVAGEIRPADLQDGFFLGNAVRELVPARLVAETESRG